MNTNQLAALSETELIDSVCHCGVSNGTGHPDLAALIAELSRRRGISKPKQTFVPVHREGPKVRPKPVKAEEKPQPVTFGAIGEAD